MLKSVYHGSNVICLGVLSIPVVVDKMNFKFPERAKKQREDDVVATERNAMELGVLVKYHKQMLVIMKATFH